MSVKVDVVELQIVKASILSSLSRSETKDFSTEEVPKESCSLSCSSMLQKTNNISRIYIIIIIFNQMSLLNDIIIICHFVYLISIAENDFFRKLLLRQATGLIEVKHV